MSEFVSSLEDTFQDGLAKSLGFSQFQAFEVLYEGYMGIMENQMETTSLRFRVLGFHGFGVLGCRVFSLGFSCSGVVLRVYSFGFVLGT